MSGRGGKCAKQRAEALRRRTAGLVGPGVYVPPLVVVPRATDVLSVVLPPHALDPQRTLFMPVCYVVLCALTGEVRLCWPHLDVRPGRWQALLHTLLETATVPFATCQPWTPQTVEGQLARVAHGPKLPWPVPGLVVEHRAQEDDDRPRDADELRAQLEAFYSSNNPHPTKSVGHFEYMSKAAMATLATRDQTHDAKARAYMAWEFAQRAWPFYVQCPLSWDLRPLVVTELSAAWRCTSWVVAQQGEAFYHLGAFGTPRTMAASTVLRHKHTFVDRGDVYVSTSGLRYLLSTTLDQQREHYVTARLESFKEFVATLTPISQLSEEDKAALWHVARLPLPAEVEAVSKGAARVAGGVLSGDLDTLTLTPCAKYARKHAKNGARLVLAHLLRMHVRPRELLPQLGLQPRREAEVLGWLKSKSFKEDPTRTIPCNFIRKHRDMRGFNWEQCRGCPNFDGTLQSNTLYLNATRKTDAAAAGP